MASDLVPLTEVVRSGRVESVHLGAVVAADADGNVVAQAGPATLTTYLRSAAKPVQLLAMLDAGLERSVALGDEELAVAAASHGGEERHVATVRRMLARAGLDESALLCGAAEPLDRAAARALAASGRAPLAVHNNCSGKHAAMLIASAANGWSTTGYLDPGHPLQRRVHRVVAELAGADPGVGVDGCGVPTYFMELASAARMMARLMALAASGGAAGRVVRAMTGRPWFTSGSARLAYALMASVPSILAKEGAEGFFALGIPAARSVWGRPIGVALKVADGAGEDARGRDPAVAAVLLGVASLTEAERAAVAPLSSPPLRNAAGRAVGCIRAVAAL